MPGLCLPLPRAARVALLVRPPGQRRACKGGGFQDDAAQGAVVLLDVVGRLCASSAAHGACPLLPRRLPSAAPGVSPDLVLAPQVLLEVWGEADSLEGLREAVAAHPAEEKAKWGGPDQVSGHPASLPQHAPLWCRPSGACMHALHAGLLPHRRCTALLLLPPPSARPQPPMRAARLRPLPPQPTASRRVLFAPRRPSSLWGKALY